jgi:hypothetical protein
MISLVERFTEQLPLFELFENAGVSPNAQPRLRARRNKGDEDLLHWLDIPMFDAKGEPTAEAVIADELIDAPEAVDVFADERLEKAEWTNEGVIQLHSVLLEQSLRALAGRGNPMQKKEILDWIFDPDYVGTVQRNGREKPVYNDRIPFTFAFCCRIERMNPDTIRDFLLSVMPAAVRYHYQ